MLAVISQNNIPLITDLPADIAELQEKLNAIRITQTADEIRLADEDENTIRVRLFASNTEEAHLLPLLTPERSLSDANICVGLLNLPQRRDRRINSTAPCFSPRHSPSLICYPARELLSRAGFSFTFREVWDIIQASGKTT